MAVRTGLDKVAAGELAWLAGKRIGLIANPSAITAGYVHAIDVLRQQTTIAALFGPEHGLRGDAQDMISVAGERDPKTGGAVHSLYGHTYETLTPTAAALQGLDALVFDIQDVGSRYYTFVWTMVLAMRAAAAAHIPFVVLDRPNPLGGARVEGGAIAPGYESFVGLVSCANRHGLTAGEIARWRAAAEQLDVDLRIVAMDGWRRAMYFEDTGLPWVMPSPNMPTVDTAVVYPGMCLVEGTEASEGRGTTRPFELFGAPFCDGEDLARELASYRLPGCVFRATGIRPAFQKHAGTVCGAVQLHVTDRRAFMPYLTGVAALRALRCVGGDNFAWRVRAYEFVDAIPAIDLLCGSPMVRTLVDARAPLADIAATWAGEEVAYAEARRAWLLYD